MVTSVALRGFVGVVNCRLDSIPIAGYLFVWVLEACLRRLTVLVRPLVIILAYRTIQVNEESGVTFVKSSFGQLGSRGLGNNARLVGSTD